MKLPTIGIAWLMCFQVQAQIFHTDIRGTNDNTDGGMFQLSTPSGNHYLRLFSGRVDDPKPYLYFNGPDTFRVASGSSDFSDFTENLTILNGLGTDGSSTTFVGISNRKPSAELDLKTNSTDDGSEIRIGNADDSHFLRFFSGRQNQFAHPSIYWRNGDSLSLGTNANGYTEILRLRTDGTMFLNSNKGIALDNGDRPLITRGWDKFTSGQYAGLGRWGVFMENSFLTFGCSNLPSRGFQFVSYNEDGTIAENYMRLKDGNLGINNINPLYKVDLNGDINISGTINLNGDSGTAGQVLTSNGAGNPSWQSPGASNPDLGFSVHLTSDLTMAVNTANVIQGLTEDFDNGSNFNAATGEFTVPTGGVYSFIFNANWSATGTPLNHIPISCDLIVNNIMVQEQFRNINLGISGAAGLYGDGASFTFVLFLQTNDVIKFSILQDGGSSIVLTGGASSATTRISGYKIY